MATYRFEEKGNGSESFQLHPWPKTQLCCCQPCPQIDQNEQQGILSSLWQRWQPMDVNQALFQALMVQSRFRKVLTISRCSWGIVTSQNCFSVTICVICVIFIFQFYWCLDCLHHDFSFLWSVPAHHQRNPVRKKKVIKFLLSGSQIHPGMLHQDNCVLSLEAKWWVFYCHTSQPCMRLKLRWPLKLCCVLSEIFLPIVS